MALMIPMLLYDSRRASHLKGHEDNRLLLAEARSVASTSQMG